MPGGRPPKLTADVQKRLCDAIRAGNFYEAACVYAGVSYSCFRKWMRRGKQAKTGQFFQFFHAVKKAQADAEVAVVAQWRQHCPDNYAACRDFLARRFPARWANKERLELTGRKGEDLQLSLHIQQALRQEDTSELLATLTERVLGMPPALVSGSPGDPGQQPPLAAGPAPEPAQP